MSDKGRLIIPALAPVYENMSELARFFLRFAVGFSLVPHGTQKLFGWFDGGGIAAWAPFFEQQGFVPGEAFAVAVGLLELVGGFLLAIGLFTRPMAFAIFVFMVMAIPTHWANGFIWTSGGWEMPFIWAAAALYFTINGGGALSIDQALPKEF